MRGFPVSTTGMEKRPTKLVASVITRAGHPARYLGHSCWRASTGCLRSSVAGCGVLAPAARAECGVSSGAAEFEDVAGAAERGLVWIRRWRRAASGVGCQIRIAGSVQFLPVPRIKSLRTPHKSGLCPEFNGWWGLAQSGN